MDHRQQTLTLGELIRVVSGCSRNDHEVWSAVADLMQRGVVVRARPSAIMAVLRTVGNSHRN